MTALKTDIELMELHDGEAGVGTNPAAVTSVEASKLTGLRHLSEVVHGHLEMRAEETADFGADMWSKIEARLDGADAVRGSSRSAIVIEDRSDLATGGHSGKRNRDLDPGASASRSWDVASKPGVWGWMARHRAHFVTGMVSAGVVAAVALWLRPDPAQPSGNSPVAIAPTGPIGTVGPVRPPTLNGSAMPSPMIPVVFKTPTEVEALDVTDGSGTVMTIADDDGETAVIWISPKDVEGL